jgi:hypothetical protein
VLIDFDDGLESPLSYILIYRSLFCSGVLVSLDLRPAKRQRRREAAFHTKPKKQ